MYGSLQILSKSLWWFLKFKIVTSLAVKKYFEGMLNYSVGGCFLCPAQCSEGMGYGVRPSVCPSIFLSIRPHYVSRSYFWSPLVGSDVPFGSKDFWPTLWAIFLSQDSLAVMFLNYEFCWGISSTLHIHYTSLRRCLVDVPFSFTQYTTLQFWFYSAYLLLKSSIIQLSCLYTSTKFKSVIFHEDLLSQLNPGYSRWRHHDITQVTTVMMDHVIMAEKQIDPDCVHPGHGGS